MIKPIKIILGICLFVTAVILLLQIDDELQPEAQAMYDKATQFKESKAYIYYWGIQTALDEDPQETGNKIFNSIKMEENKYFNVKASNFSNFVYQKYPQKKLINFSNPLDVSNEPDRLDKLFSIGADKTNELTAADITLMSRYHKFLEMKDFHTLTSPHTAEPIPAFQFIIHANDQVILKAIKRANENNTEEATVIILNNIKALRSHFKQADSLIGKMVYAVTINRNLDALSVLIHKSPNKPQKVVVPPLDFEERDLEKAMNREFGMIYSLGKMMDKSSDFFGKEYPSPGWLVRVFFKPNMFINASYPEYQRISEYSKLSNLEFTEVALKYEEIPHKKSFIRNYMGTQLLKMAPPSYIDYVGRIFALDAKIKLFNETVNNVGALDDVSHIKNPFYAGEKNAYFSKNKKSVCFEIPVEIKEQRRCLRIKLN